ncbi:MAG TPA: MBL fold metallo-hydrolase, partial [Candidatus Binatia bacterium]|nr:MBL fold metallo-hydrolase [Candidatus Binatia bacterium]
MRRATRLRLSLFTATDLAIGRAPLTPQNSQADPRREIYLQGMVAYLNDLLRDYRRGETASEALSRLRAFLPRLPCSDLVTLSSNGRPGVAEAPGARDTIAFHADRLKILFLDGLHRGAESPAIPAGRFAPQVARIVSALARGVSESALSRLLAQGGVDMSGAIEGLRAIELIEEVDPSVPIVPQSLREGGKDRLTWLGHACVLLQTARASVCVDPFLRPHLKWTAEESRSSFSDDFGDRLLFEPYGPGLPQLSPAQLPPLDAVFITHQDTDHCNLGVLMMLPEDVPIVVPEWRGDHPWEVDLAALIRRVLGRRRRIVRLKHGETVTIGDLRATAFPFVSEVPSSLTTRWNCYLFETPHGAVACTADSAVTDEGVDFLIGRLGRRKKPFVLCARALHSGETSPGYRDDLESLFNFTRLWAWYMPVWDLFQPVEQPGISEGRFRRLARRTNLRFYLPYAMGTAPWFRIADANDPLHVPMANLSARDLRVLSDSVTAISRRAALFPGKFARPFPLAEA